MRDREIFDLIVEHTRQTLPELQGCEIDPSDRLADLGANSIDRFEIVSMTLHSLSLKLPLAETLKAKNIGELAALLHARL